jgi:hypothetical protein
LDDAKVINQWATEGNNWNPYLGEDIFSQGGPDYGQVQDYTNPIKAGFDITLPGFHYRCTMNFEAGVSKPTFDQETLLYDPTKHYVLKIEGPYSEGSAATVNIKIVDP